MLDLCAGLGAASYPMRERGWEVTTLDIHPRFGTDVVADVRDFHWRGGRLDLIWASPPCDEFSREAMPWCRTGKTPSTELARACKRIIDEARPRCWVIENVRGAVEHLTPILGRPLYVCNPYYLWGSFPDISHVRVLSHKERLSSARAAERAAIPFELARGLAMAIEMQLELIEVA